MPDYPSTDSILTHDEQNSMKKTEALNRRHSDKVTTYTPTATATTSITTCGTATRQLPKLLREQGHHYRALPCLVPRERSPGARSAGSARVLQIDAGFL